MKFSVIFPTYNRAPILRDCLKSWMAQDYPDYEVLVVDDGSTDDTRAIVETFPQPKVRCIGEPHQASARLFNVGLKHSTGDVILTSDDDCLGPPNWLSVFADGFRRYPEAAAVGCYAGPPLPLLSTNRFARYDDWEWRNYGGRLTEYFGGRETPTAGLVAFKRAALEEVGGFDERLGLGGQDYDIKQRLTQRGHRFLYLPLRIDHHRPFTRQSFYRQHLGRGRAVVRVELATRGRGPGYGRILLRAAKRVLMLAQNLVILPDKTLAWTIFEAWWCDCLGQWQEQSRL